MHVLHAATTKDVRLLKFLTAKNQTINSNKIKSGVRLRAPLFILFILVSIGQIVKNLLTLGIIYNILTGVNTSY